MSNRLEQQGEENLNMGNNLRAYYIDHQNNIHASNQEEAETLRSKYSWLGFFQETVGSLPFLKTENYVKALEGWLKLSGYSEESKTKQ